MRSRFALPRLDFANGVGSTDDKKSQIKNLVVGLVMGYAITCIVFLGYSMLITYTEMSESSLPLVVGITTVLSVLVAGFDAARGAAARGWLWGMWAGFLYVVIMAIILMTALNTFIIDGRTITVIALALAGGAIGGMMGINAKKPGTR